MSTVRMMIVGVALGAVACKGGAEPGVPTENDRDGDGLTNAEEAAIGSDPDTADTDRDGWDDYVEVNSHTDPLNGFDHPYSGGWTIDACRADIEGTGQAIGQVAQNFSLMDQHGEPVRLHDFCDRSIVLASGAGWCEPCRREAPFLQAMYDKYEEDGLFVITLIGEDVSHRTPSRDVLQEWADAYGLTHPVLQDTSFSVTSLFTGSSAALPSNQLIRRGVVVEELQLNEITERDVQRLLEAD